MRKLFRNRWLDNNPRERPGELAERASVEDDSAAVPITARDGLGGICRSITRSV